MAAASAQLPVSRLRRAALVALGLVVACYRWSSEDVSTSSSPAFAAQSHLAGSSVAPNLGRSRDLVARWAYQTILRRDPTDNAKLQKWSKQQLKLVKRQEAGGWSETSEKKQAYLRKLGLASKAEELAEEKPAWHIKHLAPGDVFAGSFQHPDVAGGTSMDITLKVTSPTEGEIESKRGDFSSTVSIKQDFPISFEGGAQQNDEMTAYIFHKFNAQWRNFDQPVPSDEDCKYLTLKLTRLFFKQIADADDFPSESEFNENCADPSKGMTREEFLKYTVSDDPTYLERSFPRIFTGRRLQMTDGDLQFDGDFVVEADRLIYGYLSLRDSPGGTFSLELMSQR